MNTIKIDQNQTKGEVEDLEEIGQNGAFIRTMLTKGEASNTFPKKVLHDIYIVIYFLNNI